MANRNDTVYVLSFPGGGMKGYLSLRWFKRFVQLWGIPETDIYKYFDVIAGTSVGGIIALALSMGFSLDDLESFFVNDGKWIFTTRSTLDIANGSINATFPSNRPWTTQKLYILGDNDQFYRSVSPDSNYGSARLKSKLIETFGTNTLQNVKTNVIIPSYRSNTSTPVFFSNLNYAEFIGQNELISNVALNTSAAPLYLPPIVSGTSLYVDGGVVLNNPASRGLSLGKALKPTTRRACVLSIGTGLGEVGFYEEEDPMLPPPPTFPFEGTLKSLIATIDASITGAQESIAKTLQFESDYALTNLYYHGFQIPLDKTINTDFDNSDASFLEYMIEQADISFNTDIDNISRFIGHLNT